MNEIFIEIAGFNGYYKVSNMGIVISIKEGEPKYLSLKPHPRKGYISVSLTKDKHRKTVCLHRLVAEHFLPKPDNKKATQINHKNGIKTDNRADNLEWVTHSQNIQHAYDIGLMKATYGARKLTIDQIISIKKLLQFGMSCKKVGDLYNMSDVQILSTKKRPWNYLKKAYSLSRLSD